MRPLFHCWPQAELAQRLAELATDHEAQLTAVMVKQSLMAEQLEALSTAQHAQQQEADTVGHGVLEARHAAEVAALRQRHEAELQAERAEHAADVAALVAAAAFRSALAQQEGEGGSGQPGHAAHLLSASFNSTALKRAFRHSPDLNWLCPEGSAAGLVDGEPPFSRPPSLADASLHNPLAALASPGRSAGSVASSPHRSGPRAVACRITAAANSAGTPLSHGSSAARSARRCLIPLGGEEAGAGQQRQPSPLSAGWGGGSPERAPAGAAEVARLAGLLEEALGEVER